LSPSAKEDRKNESNRTNSRDYANISHNVSVHFDTPLEEVNSLSTLGKHYNVLTKVWLRLPKETWIKPQYYWVVIFVKRKYDTL
jgi:hypothetical protein